MPKFHGVEINLYDGVLVVEALIDEVRGSYGPFRFEHSSQFCVKLHQLVRGLKGYVKTECYNHAIDTRNVDQHTVTDCSIKKGLRKAVPHEYEVDYEPKVYQLRIKTSFIKQTRMRNQVGKCLEHFGFQEHTDKAMKELRSKGSFTVGEMYL